MGEQTCVVLVGFVIVHVAVILSLVSMATPDWIRGEPRQNMTTFPANETGNLTTKGFWQICQDKTCSKLNQTIQTESFRSSQVLFSMGTVFNAVGALLMYTYLSLTACQNSFRTSVFATASFLFSSFCMLTAVIIYGLRAMDENPELDGQNLDVKLSWSYYCGIAAIVGSFLATIVVGRRTQKVRGRLTGYEDI